MSFPVRCFTCGKVLAPYENRYYELLEEGKTPLEIFIMLNIERYCCRGVFLCHVDILNTLVLYENDNGEENESKN